MAPSPRELSSAARLRESPYVRKYALDKSFLSSGKTPFVSPSAIHLLDGLYDSATDSDEVKAIVDEYKALIDREFASAGATGSIPYISGDDTDENRTLVEACVDAVNAQREKEAAAKQAAKDELASYADELEKIAAELGFGDIDLSDALSAEQGEIEAAVGMDAIEDAEEAGKAALDEALLDAIKDLANKQIADAKDEAVTGAGDDQTMIGNINNAADDATDAINAAGTPEEVKEALDNGLGNILTASGSLEAFEKEYGDLLNKPEGNVTAEEIIDANGGTQGALDRIDEALDALDRFPDPVKNSDAGEALRNELLEKKKDVLQSALEDLKDQYDGADSVINEYIEKLEEAVSEIGDAGNGSLFDEKVNGVLDEIFEEAKNAAEFEDYKHSAVEIINGMAGEDASGEIDAIIRDAVSSVGSLTYDPDRSLEDQKAAVDAIVDRTELNIDLQETKDEAEEVYRDLCGQAEVPVSNSAINAIQNAGSESAVDKALGDAVKDIIDSLVKDGDSDAVKAIADQAKQEAETAAGRGSYDDLQDIVTEVMEALDEQRNMEKEEAKAELDKIFEEGSSSLTGGTLSEAEDLLNAAKEEIDNAEFNEYPLIGDIFEGQLDILEKYEEALKAAEDAGFTDLDNITSAKDDALAAVGAVESEDGIAAAVEEGILNIDKALGVTELESYITSEDGDKIKDLVSDGADQIAGATGIEEIDSIVEEIKQQIDAARVEQEFGTDQDLGDITADDLGALEDALEKYDELDDALKEILDESAREEGYSGFPGKVEDLLAKAEFEAEKDKVLDAVEDFLREHDGEYVQDILQEQLDKIGSVEYEQQLSDEARKEYLESMKEQLETALETADNEISHAQDQQRAENQLKEDIEDKLSTGKYSDEQKQMLEDILAEATEALRGVEAGSTDAEKAEAQQKLDDILNEMLEKLDASPVSGVSVGDIKPDKTPSVDGGTGDYEPDHDGSIWGIVTNDSGMPGSIQLVIEETESDKLDTIESAASSGSLVSAEGSELSAEEMKELLTDKDIKCALDIYLLANGVIITEFEGYYRIMVLLPEAMRDMSGLQVVFVADDGSVEVYETSVEDGKYLVFTTAHFSEFYILGDTEVSLWWLIILLAVILVIELILIVWLVVQKSDKKERTAATYSVAPVGLLAVVLVPNGAVAACIVLGILCVAGAVTIAVLLAKKDKKQEPQQQEDTEQN